MRYAINDNESSVRQRLLAVSLADIALSAVTEGEFRYGVARLPGATRLKLVADQFLIRGFHFARGFGLAAQE